MTKSPQQQGLKLCTLCSSQATIRVFQIPCADIYHCLHCGHLYSHLKVRPEAYRENYFLEDYREHFCNPDLKLFHKLANFIRQYCKGESIKTLDVGTGIGLLPQYLAQCGYESYGIDISDAAIAHGTTQLGISRLSAVPVEKYNPLQQGLKQQQLITSINVIEHVQNPLEFLTHIRRLLTDDGIFIVTTVDSKSLTFSLAKLFYHLSAGHYYHPLQRVCEVHHLHHFTQRSLHYALQRTNFKIVKRFKLDLPIASLTLTPFQRCTVAGLYFLHFLLQSSFLQGAVCKIRNRK